MNEEIFAKASSGERLSFDEALYLYRNADLLQLGQWARAAKIRKSGERVYYNINRHLNISNICVAECPLCAFSCKVGDKRGFVMSIDDISTKIRESLLNIPGLTEIHIVSSLYPDYPFSYYLDIVRTIKEIMPHVHIQAFTPVEIVYFAKLSGLSISEVLLQLQTAGLDSLPGGGAEILDDNIRKLICPDKASTAEWIDTIKTAHNLGIKTNASILYGHIETLEQRLAHLFTLRDIQDETGGFQSFLSFPFHPENTELQNITPLTSHEILKFLAIARLVLDNFEHIKAFWMMLSMPIAQLSLSFGVDDLDGTVEEEKIIHAAGAKTGQKITPAFLREIITESGWTPIERDSFYNPISK